MPWNSWRIKVRGISIILLAVLGFATCLLYDQVFAQDTDVLQLNRTGCEAYASEGRFIAILRSTLTVEQLINNYQQRRPIWDDKTWLFVIDLIRYVYAHNGTPDEIHDELLIDCIGSRGHIKRKSREI